MLFSVCLSRYIGAYPLSNPLLLTSATIALLFFWPLMIRNTKNKGKKVKNPNPFFTELYIATPTKAPISKHVIIKLHFAV